MARNVSSNDVPTLIRVLESPTVLEPVFTDMQRRYPDRKLPEVNVSLVTADPTQKNPVLASGVLAVKARGGSPELVNETLKLTEKAYLSWALQQRREKLTEGVKFLDEQAPELQARSSELQGELERFRTSNNVLVPETEAAAVRSQAEELRDSLENQLAERRRLQQVRADVAAGRLTARTFTSTAGDSGSTESARSGTSVTLDVPNQPLLTELNRLEGEIAEARSIYTADSPYLRNLLTARDQLQAGAAAQGTGGGGCHAAAARWLDRGPALPDRRHRRAASAASRPCCASTKTCSRNWRSPRATWPATRAPATSSSWRSPRTTCPGR